MGEAEERYEEVGGRTEEKRGEGGGSAMKWLSHEPLSYLYYIRSYI
jgi:hypothetical protein